MPVATHNRTYLLPAGLSLLQFVVPVMACGLAIGYLTAPGEWYAQLAKPTFNVPGWIFEPVWTVLYILIAVAGWLVWRREQSGWPMKLWWTQLVLSFVWPLVFFAAHQVGLALVTVLLLLCSIIAFMAASGLQDRFAAWLVVPCAVWVAFASLLNASIWALS